MKENKEYINVEDTLSIIKAELKKNGYDIEFFDPKEELNKSNLSRLIRSLQLFKRYKGQLNQSALNGFKMNLRIIEDLTHLLNSNAITDISKDALPFYYKVKEEVDSLLNTKFCPHLRADLLRIRDKMNKYLSRFTIPYSQELSEEDLVLNESMKGKSRQEVFDYFFNEEINKIKESINEREREAIKDRAKQQAYDYVISGGELKPTKEYDAEQELAQGVLEFYNDMKQRTNYCIKFDENLSQKEEETETQKLEKYLSKVSEIVMKSEKKEE